MPPTRLWFKHIPAGEVVTLTPSSKLLIVNASLGYDLSSERGRGALRLGYLGASAAPCVAAFTRDTSEQVRLELVLLANVQYAFSVTGPFPVDLIGYYADADEGTSATKYESESAAPEEHEGEVMAPAVINPKFHKKGKKITDGEGPDSKTSTSNAKTLTKVNAQATTKEMTGTTAKEATEATRKTTRRMAKKATPKAAKKADTKATTEATANENKEMAGKENTEADGKAARKATRKTTANATTDATAKGATRAARKTTRKTTRNTTNKIEEEIGPSTSHPAVKAKKAAPADSVERRISLRLASKP